MPPTRVTPISTKCGAAGCGWPRTVFSVSASRLWSTVDGRLGADAQLQLFNDLKAVEALLVKKDMDDRMVCERVAIVGTRRYEMACMTRAERDKRADSARRAMMERAACTTKGCLSGD